ncbi:Uu.00g132610.m01.CDS01 [Anthostomella pinea]|uniref:Uu.00g132610.m01.CDS01 n=1 Tax=Anthostomella pinea TaxID=933095 RepID=A0AAI8YII2_9PEZI|nr:Uu.00g132610.m01.CDS01 [Anthostomella pinea]
MSAVEVEFTKPSSTQHHNPAATHFIETQYHSLTATHFIQDNSHQYRLHSTSQSSARKSVDSSFALRKPPLRKFPSNLLPPTTMLAYNSVLKIALLALAATQAMANGKWDIWFKKGGDVWGGFGKLGEVNCADLKQMGVVPGDSQPDTVQVLANQYTVELYDDDYHCKEKSGPLLLHKSGEHEYEWPPNAKYLKATKT